MPASNQKILTSAAALMTLGPDFKFVTRVFRNGSVTDGVLQGDLIVQGQGDPTFYTKFYNDSTDPFRNWAKKLSDAGIKRIEGRVIGDDDHFEDASFGHGWSLNYLDTWYAVETGALQFNENYLDLRIAPPATANGKVEITPNVASNYYQIVDQTRLSATEPNSVRISRPFGSNVITVSGVVKAGTPPFERSPSIGNPTLFFATVLREVLISEGIQVTGEAVDCDTLENWSFRPENSTLLVSHDSPPLSEILRGLMKRSQNLYAETLVKTLGLESTGLGSFAAGKAVVQDRLEEMGIDSATYAFMDGSGLTRYNFVSPRQLVTILEHMRESEHGKLWKSLLPIGGVDGTLRNRMKGTAAAGKVLAKTGTISNVRCLSGYVTTADGEELVFSFMLNGHLLSSRNADAVTDKVLSLLAEYSSP